MNILVEKSDAGLSEILRKYIKVNDLKNICDYYDDFEYEVIEGNSLNYNSGFSSKTTIIRNKNGDFSQTKLDVKNALFTDQTGYCHKIPINREFTLIPIVN